MVIRIEVCGVMRKLLYWFLLLLSSFVFLANPFHGVPGTDSSIFIYVARGLTNGLLPYKNIFDQKGPLLYLIDAIGWEVGGVRGIWLLDLVALGLAFWILWRTCQVVVHDNTHSGEEFMLSAFCVLVVLYHLMACGGNMPEMWIIVLEAVAWLLIIKSAAIGFVRNGDAFVMGVCMAGVVMLKLNMIAVGLPIAIVCGFDRERWLANWGFVGLGVIAGLLPIIGWFAYKGGLDDLWEVYVCYNAVYAKTLHLMRGGLSGYIGRLFLPVFGIIGINVWWISCSYSSNGGLRVRQIAWLNLVFLISSFALILVSGGAFRYYGPILPACALPLCFGFKKLRRHRALLSMIMIASVGFVGALVYVRNQGAAEQIKYADLRAMGNVVGLTDSKRAMVLGCDCYAYMALDAWCPSRFPFQGTIGYCSEHYRSKILEDINDDKMEFIVAPRGVLEIKGPLGATWASDAVKSNYAIVASNKDYDIWRRSH